ALVEKAVDALVEKVVDALVEKVVNALVEKVVNALVEKAEKEEKVEKSVLTSLESGVSVPLLVLVLTLQKIKLLALELNRFIRPSVLQSFSLLFWIFGEKKSQHVFSQFKLLRKLGQLLRHPFCVLVACLLRRGKKRRQRWWRSE